MRAGTCGRLHLGLTDAGKLLLRGIGFVAVAALVIPAFGVLSTLVTVVLVALLVGFVLRPRIQVRGSLPDRVSVGHTTQLRYQLTNVGRLPAYNVYVRFRGLPDAVEQVGAGHVVSRLAPGDATEVTITIRPKRRGRYPIKGPVCASSFPFNLFSFGASHGEEEILLVLPAFSRLRIPRRHVGRHVSADSERYAGRIGISAEYMGNRPFVPGDSPRRIDARAWARLSVPATKEYDDDLDNYTALVLDTDVSGIAPSSGSEEIKELEAAVSLCASVAFTINSDCLIDFLLAGPDLFQLTGRPRIARLDKIHEILAGVEPSRGYRPEQMAPAFADRLYQISEVVFILLDWSEEYRSLVELAEQAGCRSTVLLIDGGSAPAHVDRDSVSRTPNVQFLSADEILAGRVKRL